MISTNWVLIFAAVALFQIPCSNLVLSFILTPTPSRRIAFVSNDNPETRRRHCSLFHVTGLYYKTEANLEAENDIHPDIIEKSRTVVTTTNTKIAKNNDSINEQPISNVTKQHQPITAAAVKNQPHQKNVKPIIAKIESFREFQSYLNEDSEKLVEVKFYASWCKSCQKLRMHYDRVVKKLGDVIIERKKVQGKVRFASIEYDQTKVEFITETLKVHALPTLQIYFGGQYKLWEMTGETNTKELEKQLDELLEETTTTNALLELAIHNDDGILQNAIEESMYYEYPDFLDEEW